MPKVSVIVITYNTGHLISRAIQGVLDQTYEDYEIIVVDDGSTDDTKRVVMGFGDKIRYFYQKNQGISVARNRGILEARGEYIAFLDSDDWWIKDKLAVQVEILDHHPGVGLVYASVPIVNEKGQERGVWPQTPSGNDFLGIIEKGAFYQPSTVMVRRNCFADAGLFDAFVYGVEDIEMWIRIAKHYEIYEIKGRFVSYYYREDNKPPRHKIKLFSSQVRLYRKILVLYEDVPRRIVERRLARFQYLLGKAYLESGGYRKALVHIAGAVFLFPAVERVLFFGTESFPKKILKLLRPYVFLVQCVFLSLLPGKKK